MESVQVLKNCVDYFLIYKNRGIVNKITKTCLAFFNSKIVSLTRANEILDATEKEIRLKLRNVARIADRHRPPIDDNRV